jgi:predicted MFS family arabinose efflux permease
MTMAAILDTTFADKSDPAATSVEQEGAPMRWYALTLLVLVTACSAIDRNLVLILAEPVKHEFLLSDSQIGILTGAVYAVSFSVVGVPLGFLIDRTRRVRLLTVCVAIWSLMTAFSGLAASFLMLAAARAGVAAAESGAPPLAMSLLTDYFPIKERGTALGWYYTNTPIGLALGFALGAVITAYFDWRVAYFVVGAPGLILALLVFFTLDEPIRGAFDASRQDLEARSTLPWTFKLLWERKALFFLIVGGVMVIIAWSGIVAFLAPYLIRVHHLSIGSAGSALAATLGATGLIGMPFGGVIADSLARRSEAQVILFTAGVLLLTAAAAAGAFYVSDLTACFVLVGAFSFLTSTFYGPTFRTYLNHSPVAVRGATGAFMIVTWNLVGYGVGPTLTGALTDVLKTAGIEQPLQAALAAMAGFYALAAVAFVAAATALTQSHRD